MKKIICMVMILFPQAVIPNSQSVIPNSQFVIPNSPSVIRNSQFVIKLDRVLEKKENYVIRKEQDIKNLKKVFELSSLTVEQEYEVNRKLYEEYLKYQSDSAVKYMEKNLELSEKHGNQQVNRESQIRLSGLYSTKGMYLESKFLLDQVDRSKLSPTLLAEYYRTASEFYSHYGQSNNNADYYRKSSEYRDSLLSVLDPHSLQYKIESITKALYRNENVEQPLLELLSQTQDEDRERATIGFLLASYYQQQGKTGLQEQYYALSAITDIINCIKDNASLNKLAITCYQQSDVDRAYRFFQAAIDDAVYCNVRYRYSEASEFYPVITENYHHKELIYRNRLQLFLVIISILSVGLLIGMAFIYIQIRRLSQFRHELSKTNLKLKTLNDDLLKANNRLNDSNHIKEEYIAHFFDLCSTYINKLENYRKSLLKQASNKQYEQLLITLRSTTLVDTELEELYKKFDTVFLALYPTFVQQYNALQAKDARSHLKPGELLNTELRIFALIRLGITDSVKIASFLRYSISTIYNYRVKARNNALTSRDRFEEQVGLIMN